MSTNGRKTSEILEALAANATTRVALGDLVASLGDRAFGLLMLIFALPNAVGLGTIPGVSTVFGAPQIIFALQMIAGLEKPWLPGFLMQKSISAEDFRSIVAKSGPQLDRVERMLRPRLEPLTSPLAERVLGIVFLVLATIVALPIPLGNWPPAIAMAVIALGLVERDGVVVIVGTLFAVIAIAIALAVVSAGAAAVWIALHWLLQGGG
ncbi:MAG: exopolysaccharide biosynthesis protein [Alphaproteobacteria bacterium]|nr:exopolysaccharide biosynthesis protein [Alphaproteobacteria bacterium]